MWLKIGWLVIRFYTLWSSNRTMKWKNCSICPLGGWIYNIAALLFSLLLLFSRCKLLLTQLVLFSFNSYKFLHEVPYNCGLWILKFFWLIFLRIWSIILCDVNNSLKLVWIFNYPSFCYFCISSDIDYRNVVLEAVS